ncbi:hypothetical protein WJ970_14615 [Achromobacter xylosoxidans]
MKTVPWSAGAGMRLVRLRMQDRSTPWRQPKRIASRQSSFSASRISPGRAPTELSVSSTTGGWRRADCSTW